MISPPTGSLAHLRPAACPEQNWGMQPSLCQGNRSQESSLSFLWVCHCGPRPLSPSLQADLVSPLHVPSWSPCLCLTGSPTLSPTEFEGFESPFSPTPLPHLHLLCQVTAPRSAHIGHTTTVPTHHSTPAAFATCTAATVTHHCLSLSPCTPASLSSPSPGLLPAFLPHCIPFPHDYC